MLYKAKNLDVRLNDIMQITVDPPMENFLIGCHKTFGVHSWVKGNSSHVHLGDEVARHVKHLDAAALLF